MNQVKKLDLNLLLSIVVVTIILLLTVGYALMDQELTISAEATMEIEKDARIYMVNFSEGIYGQENYGHTYTKDTLTTSVTISQLEGSVSYVLTLRNLGNVNMNIISSSFIDSNNENITYELSEAYPILISKGINNKQVVVTFKYKDGLSSLPENTTLTSTIKFDFASNMCAQNTIKQTYSVGDIISICNDSTGRSEEFYVIKDDGTNVTALSKYRLYVGNNYKYNSSTLDTSDIPIDALDAQYGLQSEKTIIISEDGYDVSSAYVPFLIGNNNPYWVLDNNINSSYGSSYPAFVYDGNSNIGSYLQAYQTYLSTLINDNYLNVSLISLDDLNYLGCSNSSCASQVVLENNRTWLYNTGMYWTGTAYDNSNIYYVENDGTISYGISARAGIRPVITISKASIK